MHITAQCRCGAVFELEHQFAGMTVECARCRQRFVVPQTPGQRAAVPQVAVPHAAAPQLVAPPPAKPIAKTPLRRRPSNSAAFSALLVVVIVLLCLAVPIVAAAYLYFSAKRAVREVTQGFSEVTQQFGGMAELVQNLPELGKLDETIADLKAQGYEQVSGQMLEVRKPVNRKTLYTCQGLEIDTDIRADVVIIAQLATIKGTVHGNVEFYGQILQIDKSGVVKGNVHTKVAQGVVVDGTIEGQLSGGYQGVQNNGRIVGGVKNPKTAEAIGSIVKSARDSSQHRRVSDAGTRNQASASANAGPASRVDELLSKIKSGSSFDDRNAARELARLQPADKDRSRVVASLLPLLDSSIGDDEAAAALKTWVSREELPRLQEALRQTSKHDDDRLRALLALMAQLGEQQEVVAYLNHSDSRVRSDVARQMSQWSVAPALIVGQCVKDLSSRDRETVSSALSNLKKLSLEDESLQRRVVTAAIPLLVDHSHDDDARELVSKYGIVDKDLPALMPLYRNRSTQREMGDLLASTKNPTALQFLASQMGPGSSDVERLFIELGAEGERYMWPLLEQSNNHIVRGMACRVLAKTGTEKSLRALAPWLEDTLSGRDAQRAIDSIQERLRDRP